LKIVIFGRIVPQNFQSYLYYKPRAARRKNQRIFDIGESLISDNLKKRISFLRILQAARSAKKNLYIFVPLQTHFPHLKIVIFGRIVPQSGTMRKENLKKRESLFLRILQAARSAKKNFDGI